MATRASFQPSSLSFRFCRHCSREGLSAGSRSVRTYAQIPVKEAANIRELSLATRVRNRRALDRHLDTAPKTTNESAMCKPLECTFAGTRNLHCTATRRARSSRALMCSIASFHGVPKTRRQCHQPGSIEDRGKNPGCSQGPNLRSSLPLCVWRRTSSFTISMSCRITRS